MSQDGGLLFCFSFTAVLGVVCTWYPGIRTQLSNWYTDPLLSQRGLIAMWQILSCISKFHEWLHVLSCQYRRYIMFDEQQSKKWYYDLTMNQRASRIYLLFILATRSKNLCKVHHWCHSCNTFKCFRGLFRRYIPFSIFNCSMLLSSLAVLQMLGWPGTWKCNLRWALSSVRSP